MTSPTRSCLVCKGRSFSQLVAISGYRLWSCRQCHLWTLLPRQSTSRDDDYESVLDLSVYISYMRPFRSRQYRTELTDLLKISRGKRILDVGSAAGWFVKEAANFGYQAFGVEPQKSLASLAKAENPSRKIVQGEISAIRKFKNQFDAICLWSVLEHLDNPQEDLLTIHSKLNKGGVLAIRTPNSQGLLQKLSILFFRLSRGKFKLPLKVILQLEFASKHWFLFSQENLTRFLESNGFRVSLSRQSTSIDWRHLGDWYKARKLSPGVATLLILQLAFAANSLVAHIFHCQDDLVIFAVKK